MVVRAQAMHKRHDFGYGMYWKIHAPMPDWLPRPAIDFAKLTSIRKDYWKLLAFITSLLVDQENAGDFLLQIDTEFDITSHFNRRWPYQDSHPPLSPPVPGTQVTEMWCLKIAEKERLSCLADGHVYSELIYWIHGNPQSPPTNGVATFNNIQRRSKKATLSSFWYFLHTS